MTEVQDAEERQTTVIRVLFLAMTGFVADLVRQIVAPHDDIEIVGSLPNPPDLNAVGAVPPADLLIIECDADRAGLRRLDPLLAARPGLKALAIEDDGRSASMYALVPRFTQLGPLSADRLIDFIRASGSHSSTSEP